MLDLLYRVGNAQQRHWAALGMERNWGEAVHRLGESLDVTT